ncbi:MAG: S-layer homology domain-containing protein [Anaerolineales bacterium]|nr:S-layer homology domain-containing protein [Anaerolineales bacterium]
MKTIQDQYKNKVRLIFILFYFVSIAFPFSGTTHASPASVPSRVPNQFLDVPYNHWAAAWINQFYTEGVTGGCNQIPLRYCPENYVTRAQMAVFILKTIHGTAYTPSTSPTIFADVPTTYWAAAWINQLYTEGITGGCAQSPLQYCPEQYVTRAQMSVFILKALYGSNFTPGISTNPFTDVPDTHWARAWINQLYAESITGGCAQSPLQYCPEQYVTRAQMAVFILKAIHGSTYQPPDIDISSPSLGGCPMFPVDNIWNTPIDTLPVHARSEEWINSIGADKGFHMDFGSGTWEGGTIGMPYNIVSGISTPHYSFEFLYESESDPGPYPIPDDLQQEDGTDHHILVIDTDNCYLYEIYDGSYSDGQWYGGGGAIWNLNSNALRPDHWTSADAAGLPILPGLARYDEIEAGAIHHALRFTVGETNSYIWPARHLTSGTAGVLTSTPPMGARFRLKASYDISGFPPEMQIILQAMKTYGIIIADNGSDWYVSGAPDERWDNDMLHLLDVLQGSDFEAVDSSSLIVHPDSGQAQ